jgi:phospholipid-binding lipoprotein MlaA
LAGKRAVRANGFALALLLALSGCASREVIIHRLPQETPAADNDAAIKRAKSLAAEAAATRERAKLAPPSPNSPVTAAEAPPVTAAEAPPLKTYDPWGRANRFTYRFNARFDDAVFLPAANHYRMMPAPLRAGVHNFFANLGELDSIINYTLQGRLGRGLRSVGRFAINSTLGFGGLFEVAEKLHLPRAPTGFGATLATWGMHPGAYLVIPFYGPSTAREGLGLAGDYGALYAINLANLYRGSQSWALDILDAVDQRANLDFAYYETGSPFEYEMVRFLYVRKLLIEDAKLHPPQKRDPDREAGE